MEELSFWEPERLGHNMVHARTIEARSSGGSTARPLRWLDILDGEMY